ncbi:hypothetical protein E2562_034830 [Oryza meyeriana var. granulata]|uniref:Uncharacterized protein n=1 Tax=Oryza meyeriana var. granulata TaxID=110450 RepID=A0A6G1E6F7_9ORYZ|nr:hypothetical protein E2562_034830 [Oryza meyeriana var. granulata]
MNTPRMQYYTKSMLKQWKRTVYGRNGISEVQPDEIEYIVVPKEDVKKRPRLHETSDAKKNVKKRSRLHETSGVEEDESGKDLLN